MAKKIRVALVCTSVNQFGGKIIHMKNLYKYLNSDDLQLFIFCCSAKSQEMKNFMLNEGVKEDDFILLTRFSKWLVIPFILQLRSLLIEKKIDIVHTFQIQSDVYGALAARLAGIKYIFSLFESKVIPDNISVMKKVFYKLVNKVIKGWFIKTVAVSRGLKNELITSGIRASDRIALIPLGFDIPDRYRDYPWSFDTLYKGRPVIGLISRLSKEKGIESFVATMPLILQKVPGASFIIVGKGPEEEKLKQQVKKLNLESKVIFKRWVDSIFTTLESIDIFVMPSIREGCPTSLLEASALSRPVVAARIEGVIDIIDDEVNGLLVDTTDTQAFAAKIISLCLDPQKAILLGANAYNKVVTKFTREGEILSMRQMYLSPIKSAAYKSF
ncbi:MAG: glycosyltransferase family 4 protein [Parcubacteria group bacterium]|nr:glycosyltransferase family 4 protein [Parcubacteria group bacterium]